MYLQRQKIPLKFKTDLLEIIAEGITASNNNFFKLIVVVIISLKVEIGIIYDEHC